MSYHPRIETTAFAQQITTRTRNSELWFILNQPLEDAILGYAAKYAKRYDVKLYALAIEGSHTQGPVHFNQCNRSSFMRDLNSSIARAVPRFVPTYPGGNLFGRRYSNEFLPLDYDVEKNFFYTVLQPIHDALVDRISDYPGYNCFHDAVFGIEREFKIVRWGEYNAAKRDNPGVKIKDFTDIFTLKYERLPGYEHLSQVEYAKLMHDKLEEYRIDAIIKRGRPCLGRDNLLKMVPGTPAKSPKTSTRYSFRPRILTHCKETKARLKAWYFLTVDDYIDASKRYQNGEYTVEFPAGTYKPHIAPDVPAAFQ